MLQQWLTVDDFLAECRANMKESSVAELKFVTQPPFARHFDEYSPVCGPATATLTYNLFEDDSLEVCSLPNTYCTADTATRPGY